MYTCQVTTSGQRKNLRQGTHLDGLLVALLVLFKVIQPQSLGPTFLVKVHQHPLLCLGFTVIDVDT
jgi:hypothetical protein